MKRRAILIVLDSVGIGALPDAAAFGSVGAHTLGNLNALRRLDIPNLHGLGLYAIQDSRLLAPPGVMPRAAYGRAMERAPAMDTTSGHWEMMGLVLEHPFRTYPEGFPAALIREFEQNIGRGTLGNRVASGTAIIQELGDEHVAGGKPIVYTSADSVFQIAAHEDVIPLEELYRISGIAREMLAGEHTVGRVIARPFVGASGAYVRTKNRRDFSLAPPGKTVLDALAVQGYEVYGIGKIEDIFARRGVTHSRHTGSNADGISSLLELIAQDRASDLIFANLVDFDMHYGHRNDVEGYARALEEFDGALPAILSKLRPDDLLVITADHGCDPTHPGTDHTREYVPVLAWSSRMPGPVALGTLPTFADVGATVYEHITRGSFGVGRSFLSLLNL